MDCFERTRMMQKGGETMRRGTGAQRWTWMAALAATAVGSILLAACGGSDDPNDKSGSGTKAGAAATLPPTTAEQIQKILDSRQTNYGEALRTASLKLRDRLPDLSEIKQVDTTDPAAGKTAYEALIDAMLESPDFSQTMISFWQNTFRTAQVGGIQANVDKDAAANFAAQVTTEGRSYTELFTTADNTCPTFDGTSGKFTPAACATAMGGMAVKAAGLLNDQGLMSQYFSNMGFRRVRFIQETFACQKFPAELAAQGVAMGNGSYTGVEPFNSITGKDNKPDAKINFQDTSSTICANCHSTINHIAPLFTKFDDTGALMGSSQVQVPIPGTPFSAPIDYLPAGESLAWRTGKPVTDMAGLGAAMAADGDVARCAVNRVWNYAMSRGDIVNDVAAVPNATTQTYVDQFTSGGMKLKETIRAVFKSEDFTKF